MVNLTADGHRSFVMPHFEAPIHVFPKKGEREDLTAHLDTIVIEPDEERLTMTWRVARPLRKNMFEIAQVLVGKKGKDWWEQRNDALVGRRHARARIDQHQREVALGDRGQRLARHLGIDAGLLAAEPPGVDQDEAVLTGAELAVLAIAREPRDVGNQRIAAARETVEQRRLADVGPSYQRDDGQHRGASQRLSTR